MAKLSVATPTFGTPKYLERCIDSVYNQSVDTVHIVCGGNLVFNKKYDGGKVKFVLKNPDPGMVSCWGIAVSLAETEYIGFIADDNTFEPTYSHVMVDFMETHPECDLVFCNQRVMDSAGGIDDSQSKEVSKYFGRNVLQPGIINKSEYGKIFQMNTIPLEACIIRKNIWDLYGPFKEDSRGSFDQEFIFRMLLNDVKIGFVPQYLMNFRWHEAAYSNKQRRDHIIGSIWTNESLMGVNEKYTRFFKEKNTLLKGQLLRYKLKPLERANIMLSIIFQKNGLKYIFRNTIAKIIGRGR